MLLSDYFLQRDGFLATIKRIKQEKIKKIVIVGGSHSGFSSAHMLLNGPTDLWHNTSINNTQKKNHKEGEPYVFPGAVYKTSDKCTSCCVCSLLSPKKSPSKLSKKSSDLEASPSKPKKNCECVCKCFGFFRHKQWDFDYKTDIPDWEEADI